MIIRQNFTHDHRQWKILNLKSECMMYDSVRRGSYGLQDPSRKGGPDEDIKAQKKSWCVVEYRGLYIYIFWTLSKPRGMGSTKSLGILYWWES